MTYTCAQGHEYTGWCRPCNAAAVRRYKARLRAEGRMPPRASRANGGRKGPAPRPIEDRFWEKVDASGDCWVWTAAVRNGYGAFTVRGNEMRVAHRVAYELLVGPVPTGLQLDHLCRNHACVNPDHLEPVTARENTLRSPIGSGARARRTHCPQGHEYTPANTRLSRRNQRNCRTCAVEQNRVWKLRQRAVAA